MLFYRQPVRALGCLLVFACLAACPARGSVSAEDFGAANDGGVGATPQFCTFQSDCALAAATCCSCPTFAVNVNDPAHRACLGVTCPPTSCPENVEAICSTEGRCELACSELSCPVSCPDGFAIDDATGCLSCTCATSANRCTQDAQCVETRADCCGCRNGGRDTAVLVGDRAGYDAALDCPPSPVCPEVDTCEAGAAPHCIQGDCKLVVAGALPPNACGRDGLPACPPDQVCTINRDPAASVLGVGSCVQQ